jgi:hypothetical protein
LLLCRGRSWAKLHLGVVVKAQQAEPRPNGSTGTFVHLVYARALVQRLLTIIAVDAAILAGLISFATLVTISDPELTYQKAFLQDYVVARAIIDGVDPYVSVQELARHYIGPVPPTVFDHPTPHPPTMGVLFLPLAQFRFNVVSYTWLAIELLCLFASVFLLAQSGGRRITPPAILAAALILIAWPAARDDLSLGQMNFVLLLVMTGALHAWRSNRRVLGGVLVGVSLLFKQIFVPVLLLLALRRDWRSVGGSLAAVALGYGVTAAVMGPREILTYFTRAVPAVTEYYRVASWNLSLSTLGWRAFHGTNRVLGGTGIEAEPLLRSDLLAAVTSIAIPALVLLVALWSTRSFRLEWSLSILVCVSLLVSPVAWDHYLILACLPAAHLVEFLVRQRFPRRATLLAGLVAAPLVLPYTLWSRISLLLAGQSPAMPQATPIPFVESLLTMAPTFALGAFTLLLWTVARRDCRADV